MFGHHQHMLDGIQELLQVQHCHLKGQLSEPHLILIIEKAGPYVQYCSFFWYQRNLTGMTICTIAEEEGEIHSN